MPRISQPTLCFGIVAAVFSTFATLRYFNFQKSDCGPTVLVQQPQVVVPSKDSLLLGPPTTRFRDNLRNDTRYITTFADSGWTNEVMLIGNLLYLSTITHRVPILPPFAPSHVGRAEPLVPFSDVFDLPRLSAAMGVPILEWDDVKLRKEAGSETEVLGCWSVWLAVKKEGFMAGQARHQWPSDEEYDVDMSYTPAPDWISTGIDDHTTFWRLARLGWPGERLKSLNKALPSKVLKQEVSPDDQVLCFDFLYYVSADESFDYEREYSPAWNEVMKHARWTKKLQDLADVYIRDTFDLAPSESIPPFIVIHARHGDFTSKCLNGAGKCLPPLTIWADQVAILRTELRQQKGLEVDRVIITSDEKSEEWWKKVDAFGWKRIDHAKMRTVERYGKWWEIFIDVAIQASGKGFLGTEQSTLSLLSRRRTVEWNDGIGKQIQVSWDT